MIASIQTPAADLQIDASADGVSRASLWLEQTAGRLALPEAELLRLDLCLNEALANVISHGNPAALASPILVRFDLRQDGDFNVATVTVSDAGPAFDAASAPLKPRPRTLAEAEPGGLGLLMIRSFSDDQHYHYGEGRNHLGFSVRWVASQ
jgi:anti-sigma regulatory factor (Ser/Thr protein kinase)